MSDTQTWSTDLVPEKSRFPAWADLTRALHLDWDLSTSEDDYAAQIRYRRTGTVRVADVVCAPFEGHHAPTAGPGGVVGVQLQLSGRLRCSYGEEEFVITPGDLFVWEDSREGAFVGETEQHQLSLLVPRSQVPQSLLPALANSRPLPAAPGTGTLAIVADQLRGIANEMDRLSDEAVNRTVRGLFDLLELALAPVADSTPGERGALLSKIQQYILERLDDTQLSVRSIAAAHWISVRTLHLVFSESGTSVARWVRQQRLERCRRELMSATGSTTITSVAFRWGFNDASHFSRAFKQEFGVPPSAVMAR